MEEAYWDNNEPVTISAELLRPKGRAEARQISAEEHERFTREFIERINEKARKRMEGS